jgi:hypothetical protein
MVSDDTVVSLDQREWAERRAARQLVNLVLEARMALDEVLAGDVDAVWSAHLLMSRAVVVTERHRFATSTWRPA